MRTDQAPLLLKHYPFDFIQAHVSIRPVREFGCPGRLVRSHILGLLECSTVERVNGNPSCPECVAADRGGDLACRPWIGATICALHKNAQAGIISNQCRIFVQLVEAAKVEMSLIESCAGDYRRWSRIEQIVSPAFLIAALGGVASMFTPLLGG